MALVLGIDPGSRFTGWGIIETDDLNAELSKGACRDFGVIVLNEKLSFERRMALLFVELNRIITTFLPSEMAVEKVFFGRNADSAFKLGHARGVVLAAAGVHKMVLAEYATRHVKKMLTGSGAASKEQVQCMILHILKVQTDNLDATDALALAVCHGRERETNLAIQRQQKDQEKRQQKEGQL